MSNDRSGDHAQYVSVLCAVIKREVSRMRRRSKGRRAFAANLADLIWVQRTIGCSVGWGDWWAYRCSHLSQPSAERSWERLKVNLSKYGVPHTTSRRQRNSGNVEVVVDVGISELEIDQCLGLEPPPLTRDDLCCGRPRDLHLSERLCVG
jgi:hypothetical protein